ncbi:hypothetical protein CCZ01_04485 [Helicobacter monodelphidis]|nr:hypothetical protein CCZ01_04485 [Helicobacter sp. 15-1451]
MNMINLSANLLEANVATSIHLRALIGVGCNFLVFLRLDIYLLGAVLCFLVIISLNKASKSSIY